MADMADSVIPGLEEIQNMKVADLRKKLRAFGLPASGNKTELIERLQEAFITTKGDSFDSSQFGFDDSQISELDSADDNSATIDDTAALLDQDQDHLSLYVSSSSLEDSKVLTSTENQLSSNPVIMPPKKRSIPKIISEVPPMVEKKVSLNRTNVANVDFNIKNVGTEQPKPQIVVSSNDKSELETKKVLSVKNMTPAERLAMRAKRFNMSNSVTTLNSTTKLTNSKNSKLSIVSSPVTTDVDVLKKRAERFGQNVSSVLKQIEQKEKLFKRKCKFGASISATSSLDEQEKKRRRAERFGIS